MSPLTAEADMSCGDGVDVATAVDEGEITEWVEDICGLKDSEDAC